MSSKTKTIVTKEEATPRLMPTLRFPEFRKSAGWDPTLLNSIADPVMERATQADNDNVLSLSAEHGIVLQSEFFGKKVAGDNAERYLKITRDDFVYNDRTTKASTFGTIKRLSKHSGGIVSPIYKCFRFHADENPVFWEQYFESGYHDAALRGLVNEGARAGRFNISISQFLSTAAFRPNETEQQKIAECLSSVDELIAAQARKVDALKTHKKGLMQQLFPSEDETQPRLRFPEFQNAGEWSEEPLDHLVHFQDGFAFKSTDFVKGHDDATQVIRITDINNKNTNEDKVYIPTAFLESNKLDKYRVDDGDLLLSLTGAAGFNFFFWNGGPAAINQRTAKVTSKRKSGDALLRLLEPLIHEKINERGEGQNNNLSKEFLSTIVLRVPEPAEQKRIATSLSSLDALITAETQKLEIFKTHKKGLMQQLFPCPEEVEP